MKFDKTIYLLGRVKNKADKFLVAELERHGLHGLAPSHGDIIASLLTHTELTMTRLAGLIDRDKSTVTALVDKLVDLGYATKKKDREDHRINLICLTDRGLALKPVFMRISDDLIARTYQGIPGEEKSIVVRVLKKMNDNF